jgi:hypothetical protein
VTQALKNIERGMIDDTTAAVPPFDLDDRELRDDGEFPPGLSALSSPGTPQQMAEVDEP